jgi:hypothetical protein
MRTNFNALTLKKCESALDKRENFLVYLNIGKKPLWDSPSMSFCEGMMKPSLLILNKLFLERTRDICSKDSYGSIGAL